ncbi:MAG: hypothetical protein ACFNMB_03320 [Candidatus Saccharimonas sp.]|jgi:hypothetical protein|nr:hypothetical protein [Candidatus Saccharibacteria bacterium]
MTEMFLGLSPDTDKCDPELIGERIEEIEGYVASLQPGESFFENGDGLIVRANVEVNDDGDGVNHRVVGVVREEEGNDKKGWLVAKEGHIFVVHELVDNKDHDDDKREAYLLFSSKVDSGQFADCSNYDSLEQLADSLALVSGINRPSRNPFAVEKNSQ